MIDLFKGDLVWLAPVHRDSVAHYVRWMRDYEVRRLIEDDVIGPLTLESQEAWFDEAAKSKDLYLFDIRTLADDLLIGNCSLYNLDTKNRSAELGIVIGEKPYWGKGYGSDATCLILRFAFMELNLNRISLSVFGFNERAVRAYEKVGFVHEGIARQAVFREGRYHDLYLMAVLRDEWSVSRG